MRPTRPGRRSQRGVAVMMLLILMILGASFLMLRSLNASTMRADRWRVSQDVLVVAKEALIARAVTDDNRPGSLPCPDLDDDGVAELFAGPNCPSYIGRLPWKTLGLPDLRDASGERLWYALSSTYRDHPNAQPINSNTLGMLSVAGTQPAAGLAAIVFAPGAPLGNQNRTCTGGSCDATTLRCTTTPASLTPKCNAANFLDVSGGISNADNDNAYASAIESSSFNDRHLEITVDDIMWLVEKRAARELGGKLRTHFDAWQNATEVTAGSRKGFYPWAAPFNDLATKSPGVNNTANGQLPLAADNVVWESATLTVAGIPLGGCAGVGTPQIVCSGVIVCVLVCLTQINARVSGIATTFVDPPNGSEIVDISGLLIGAPLTGTWTLNPGAQALDFNYSGSALGIGLGVSITVNTPMASTWPTSATDWLMTNNWHQVVHYSVAPAYAINGTNACGTCISVAGTANNQAVVTMTGRALAGQTRITPAALAAYLEGGNLDPTDFALERGMRGPAFNDQPIAVRP